MLHGYGKETAWRWSTRGVLLPAPFVVSGHLLWPSTEPIETWSRQTGRFQGAIAAWSEELGKPAEELDFATLYDLHGLGRPDVDPRDIRLPARRRET